MHIWRRLCAVLCVLSMVGCGLNPQANSNPDVYTFAPGTTIDIAFTSNDQRLSGMFDTPEDQPAKAIILFVHGYGQTDVRGWNMYADLREKFGQLGIATMVWDKPGQGRSDGTFDINQPVDSSAQEVIDAAHFLRSIDAPGADRIGIWGISRAGWIAPLALSQDPNLTFWISVSGVTGEDNFPYLVLSNLPHEGGTLAQAKALETEWRTGCRIKRTGGPYDAYLEATERLRANRYITQMRGAWQSREAYEQQQAGCVSGACPQTDPDLCAYVFVDDFDTLLSSLNIDALAIFGEKDLNVDWRKTEALYQSTIGQNPEATLQMRSFGDADHNLNIAETGSLTEMETRGIYEKSDGYYDTQLNWLETVVLSDTAAN